MGQGGFVRYAKSFAGHAVWMAEILGPCHGPRRGTTERVEESSSSTTAAEETTTTTSTPTTTTTIEALTAESRLRMDGIGPVRIFETDGTKVESFRSGEEGSVQAIEGCA